MPKTSALSLNLQSTKSGANQNGGHPASPGKTNSPLPSPNNRAGTNGNGTFADAYDLHSPITSLPPTSTESPASPKHKKEFSKSIFSNYKATKSVTRLQREMAAQSGVNEDPLPGASNSQIYSYRRGSGSTPELANSKEDAHGSNASNTNLSEKVKQTHPVKSVSTSQFHPEAPGSKRNANKHRFQLLSRSRSIKDDERMDGPKTAKPATPNKLAKHDLKPIKHMPDHTALRTAPLEKDRSFRDMMSSSSRNRSVDRHGNESEDDGHGRGKKDSSFSSSFKDNNGTFFSNIRHSSNRAADGIEKARKGIFSKLTRSGSSHDREVPATEENYVFTVINTPLVEQTRKTRISKRLEDSKDKTEFWMPALPWRCIDYLNMKGCDQEGLYRVPGSGREIKHWQTRFDIELDIDLFNEEELYDINIIGSMFKTWLRELPDEIFPKATQARIQEACAGAKETPQMLKDELSKLPPYHYYLLFAITCHISLLHSCSKENKMDYRNLCICFQPCMKIDAFCFQWLVLDWRNCWQGCWTEKEYLKEEIEWMESKNGGPPSRGTLNHAHFTDQRTISSSSSSKPSIAGSSTPPRHRQEQSHLLSTTARRVEPEEDDDAMTPTQDKSLRLASDPPKLSPMPPISPIGPV